jgi:hypothetical protein
MNNREVFLKGKVIDRFVALNPDDLDDECSSCIIEYQTKVYEVIVNKYNDVLNPDDDVIILSNSLQEMLDEPLDMEEYKPLVSFNYDKVDSKEDDTDYPFPNFTLF